MRIGEKGKYLRMTKDISMKKLYKWAEECFEKEPNKFKLYDPETNTSPTMPPDEAVYNFLRYIMEHRND